MTEIKSCRVDNGNLIPVLDLGNQCLSDFVENGDKPSSYPLEVVMCEHCKLVQLRHSTPPQEMYHERYGFKSGVNETIKANLKEIVEEAVSWKPGAERWLDIASNDGTLLSYIPAHIEKYGIDPITKYCEEAAQHGDRIVNDFFSPDYFSGEKFDVITSISMFYDLDDPNEFVAGVKSVLDEEGIWSIQQNYLLTTMQLNAIDNVCLAKGNLVTTFGGNKPIDEIEEGEYVLTHKGRFRKVTKKFINKYDGKDLVQLQAYGAGYNLNVTKNHPIYVNRDNEWTFVPAEEVKVGDIVGKPVVAGIASSSKILPGKSLSNLGKITGYYLAEGSYYKQKTGGNVVTFSFNQNEENTHIADLVEALTVEGYSANLYQHPGTSVITVTTYGEIAKWLKDNFKSHALRKTIPMDALMWGNDFLTNLLTCYVNGDGYDYRDSYLRASTVSKDLAYGISLVANKLGYKCCITECKKDPEGTILGRKVHINNLWDILIATKPQKKMKVWMEDGMQCMRIRKVELVSYSEENVYNLEVEEDHTFVTPAMTTHNCHEHLEYYSLLSLESLLERHGLEVFDCSTNMINGGSIRTLVQHKGKRPIQDSVEKQRTLELDFGLNSPDRYSEFADSVEERLRKLSQFVIGETLEGKRIYIYGASTRGGTIWQAAGLDVNQLPKAIERNPEKVGKKIASIGVPIISEEQARTENPDYMLISPWFFKELFLEREFEYLSGGGKFIMPLPTPEVIYVENGILKSVEL